MGQVTKYNAKDCVITVDGVYITGLGEDMVSCEKNEDSVNAVVGAQGDVVLNEINDDTGVIKITVQGTSPQKSYLMGLAKSKAVVPVWVTNKSIGEKTGGTKCVVKKPPTQEQGKELADREFEFLVADYTTE